MNFCYYMDLICNHMDLICNRGYKTRTFREKPVPRFREIQIKWVPSPIFCRDFDAEQEYQVKISLR